MIVALWAEEKAWKTTMALSWPGPTVHFDIDVGGYDRAAWRVDTSQIESQSFPIPLQIEKLLGQQVGSDGITIRFPKRVVGVKETWQKFVIAFVAAVERKEVRTLIVDSATALWPICHRAHLQELQEKQLASNPRLPENDLRESLMPQEYGPPNEKMRTLIYTARGYNKNLILIHYPRDIYGEKMVGDRKVEFKTGKIEPDGFKETQRLADIVIKLDMIEIKEKGLVRYEATATITKSGLQGLGSTVTGLPIEPSYQGLSNLAANFGVELEQ